MVLSRELVKNRFNEIVNQDYKFLFLDVKSLNGQTEKIEMVIEVIALINETNRIKSIFRDLNSDISLDEDILYEIIKAIYLDKSLSDHELLKYVELTCQLHKIFDILSGLSEIEVSLPSRIEYFIFGLDFEQQDQLSKEDYITLEDKFSDVIVDNYKKADPKYIMMQQKSIIDFALKSIDSEKKKAAV